MTATSRVADNSLRSAGKVKFTPASKVTSRPSEASKRARKQYTYKQVHSTTQEVLYFRFQRALEEKRSLFREFQVRPPFQSVKDIFCLRVERTVDPSRKISLHTLQLKVNNATPRTRVTLRIYPLNKEVSEIRFWCDGTLIDVKAMKNSHLKGVRF